MKHIYKLLIFIALLLIGGVILNAATISNEQGSIIQMRIEGAIGPATDDYFERALQSASERHAHLVVIRMDTPGGLDTAMRNIVKNIINSDIPIATYVSPSGARAASAGTYILYASHIAAMAPGTNLGAATPVQIGGVSPPSTPGKNKLSSSSDDDKADTLKQKQINDAVAYIQSLAQMRGRNQDWAEKAVREAASLPAKQALEKNVIDVLAVGMGDLLQQIDGREVMVQGQVKTLQTAGRMVVPLDPDWRNRLLSILTNPNVAYILMLLGIYGLIFEFSNPGAIVPGTVGAICLLLALYSFQLLPINYAGMALIILGVVLMVAEAYQPSFGVLGIGGLISFVIGSIILMDTQVPGFGIDISVIIIFTITSALVFIFAVGMAIKARRRPVVSGEEELLNGIGVVVDNFDDQGKGKVTIHSEQWNAVSDFHLLKGQQVSVTKVSGLILHVEPLGVVDHVSTKEGTS